MASVRLDLAYNGSGFAGWATQPGERTVQEELEGALEEVLGERHPLTVAGRTDAGVHAWSQVASFEMEGEPPEVLTRALNAVTGKDVTVWRTEAAPVGFDARRDARSRTYCYRILRAPAPSPFERGLSLFWPYKLYPALLEKCAAALLGTHDFTAFTPTRNKHVHFQRHVMRSEWRRGGSLGLRYSPVPDAEILEFWITADAFLRNMVRIVMGTMLEVGSGRRDLDDFVRLLHGAPREEAGDTAQPHGLFLASVAY